jgi:hypothetical protein
MNRKEADGRQKSKVSGFSVQVSASHLGGSGQFIEKKIFWHLNTA